MHLEKEKGNKEITKLKIDNAAQPMKTLFFLSHPLSQKDFFFILHGTIPSPQTNPKHFTYFGLHTQSNFAAQESDTHSTVLAVWQGGDAESEMNATNHTILK